MVSSVAVTCAGCALYTPLLLLEGNPGISRPGLCSELSSSQSVRGTVTQHRCDVIILAQSELV